MTKDLKIAYILSIVFAGIVMAWTTFANFLGGMGVNFVALILILSFMLMLMLTDASVKSRIIDIFIVACVFTLLEFVMFIAFTCGLYIEGFYGFQAFLSIIGCVFLCYIMFRFTMDILGKKVHCIEVLLGNEKRNKVKKEKKAKELTNGSLEEKPNKQSKMSEEPVSQADTDDEVSDGPFKEKSNFVFKDTDSEEE